MATKDEIFEYVMNNPENTNPNILKEMLNNMEGTSSKIGAVRIVFNGWATPMFTCDQTIAEITEMVTNDIPFVCYVDELNYDGEVVSRYSVFDWYLYELRSLYFKYQDAQYVYDSSGIHTTD